jgi:tetratricopeptide (TPR) repeat protein
MNESSSSKNLLNQAKQHYSIGKLCEVGDLLCTQGKYKEAYEMFELAIAGIKSKLGKKHPDLYDTMDKLGLCLESMKHFSAAEAQFEKALRGKKKVLGLSHKSTLLTVFYIGELNRKLCRYSRAAEHYQIALTGYFELLGEEDAITSGVRKRLEEMNELKKTSTTCLIS